MIKQSVRMIYVHLRLYFWGLIHFYLKLHKLYNVDSSSRRDGILRIQLNFKFEFKVKTWSLTLNLTVYYKYWGILV